MRNVHYLDRHRERGDNKRTALMDSAFKLFLKQGYHVTTLSDIAHDANIPLGNVYYYYKSKAAFALGCLEDIHQRVEDKLYLCDRLSNPKKRVSAYLDDILENIDEVLACGDPLLCMCQELLKRPKNVRGRANVEMDEKLHDTVKYISADTTRMVSRWFEVQFRKLDTENEPRFGEKVYAELQGRKILAYMQQDADIIKKYIKYCKSLKI